MNLHEIINYRTHCPICKLKLQIKSDTNKFKPKIIAKQLKIHVKDLKTSVSIDGNGKYKEFVTADFNVRKFCKSCLVNHKFMSPKAGVTTLGSLVARGYFYSFNFKLEDGQCSAKMIREYFSYQNGSCLNIIDNHFEQDKLCLEKLETINNKWQLKTDSKSLKDYVTETDLLNMMNLYATFS